MVPQPGRQCWRLAIRQEVDGAMPLQINQERAVALTAAQGEVIDAENARRGQEDRSRFPHSCQEGIGADQETEGAGDLGSGLPSRQVS